MRVVPELRSVHIERFFAGRPSALYYLGRNYDLGTQTVPGRIERASLPRLVATLWRSDAEVLETPEPLWMREFPRTAVMGLTWKLSGVLRGRRRRVVSYCMENNDFATLVFGRGRRLPGVVPIGRLAIAAYIRTCVDKLAFASPAARTTYDRILRRDVTLERKDFLELPPAEPALPDKRPESAVFVGAIETRKGVDELQRAWEQVEHERPDAILTVVGTGDGAADLLAWCEQRPVHRRYLGLVSREEAMAEIARSTVLVAPSVPDGRWREQIGLPIKEALARGCQIVTTDQTGLAPWLGEHGHQIVAVEPRHNFSERIAHSLDIALDAPLEASTVTDSLPQYDQRLAADAWLHEQGSGTTTEVALVNPLGHALAHYTHALSETLSAEGARVSTASVPEPSADGSSRAAWLVAYAEKVRELRRSRPDHLIVTWPVLGWLDLLVLGILAPRGTQVSLVVHDPVPLVRAIGYSWLARLVASAAPHRVTVVAHSRSAMEALPPGRLSETAVHLPHPILDRVPTQERPTSKRTVVRVLGQYKPDRDLATLSSLGQHLKGRFELEIVGRGWPHVDGWTVEDAFVPESRLDHLIATSSVVLIPYSRFFQSGIAVRCLELGTPVVGPRDSSLADLFLGMDDLLVPPVASDAARAKEWDACIRRAAVMATSDVHDVRRDVLAGNRTAWRNWLQGTGPRT